MLLLAAVASDWVVCEDDHLDGKDHIEEVWPPSPIARAAALLRRTLWLRTVGGTNSTATAANAAVCNEQPLRATCL